LEKYAKQANKIYYHSRNLVDRIPITKLWTTSRSLPLKKILVDLLVDIRSCFLLTMDAIGKHSLENAFRYKHHQLLTNSSAMQEEGKKKFVEQKIKDILE